MWKQEVLTDEVFCSGRAATQQTAGRTVPFTGTEPTCVMGGRGWGWRK